MQKYTLHFHRCDEAEVDAEAESYAELKQRIMRGELTPRENDAWGNLAVMYCTVLDTEGVEIGEIELWEQCYE